MSRKRTVIALAGALAGALVLSACGGGGTGGGGAEASSDTVKIGFLGDLTGENAGLMDPPHKAAQLAFDEFNATNPPKKIELVDYDSQGTPEQAQGLAPKAAQQDKIVGLIGPGFSGESKAANPFFDQAKIPMISASATNPGLANMGLKYFHRTLAADDLQGPGIADFLIAAKSPQKAFVINDDSEYSTGLGGAVAKQLSGKGVTVDKDQFAQSASDFSSSVAKIKASNPQVIFFGGYYAQGGRLLKQIRDAGITATFATGDGGLDAGLIRGAGNQAAEGAVIGCPCAIPAADSTGAAKKFYDAYKAKYNAEPAVYSTEAYDAATAFIKAVQAGHTTPEAINTFLSTVDFAGTGKQIKFAPNGNVATTDIFVYQVKNGKIEPLGNAKQAKIG
ncbi:branched-chain amino acid ABC transporter substrate-binding protein [Pseudonocardia eucalypti]|uniref:Branched-chain amino acid ABC transporter substrate-binding protein n=1 Tax=Pseudonocardia eucalypti TaxID=648755 RepID=A0ABP9Q3M6_9PSEU|nr:branched-chain amino acid transport system substrate-binding protein [Pseudonocardia eucalypti]